MILKGGIESPTEMNGYREGLATIKEALGVLAGGVRDLDYWRDAVRWLGRTANVIKERSFCLSALQILFQVSNAFGASIRTEIIRATLGMGMVEINVEILEKILWLLAEVSTPEDCKSAKIVKFVESLINRISIAGHVRYELLPALLRLCAKMPLEHYELYMILAELILEGAEDIPGKVLWTLADTIPELITFESDFDWSKMCIRLGQKLLSTPNIKAKLHIASALNKIANRDDCPFSVKEFIVQDFSVCKLWLLGSERPADVNAELYEKYYELLLESLQSQVLSGR